MTDHSPLNFDMLNSFTGGDKAMMEQFFTLYIEESEKNIKCLSENCTDGQNEDWVANAHLLKGGSGSIGAEGMHRLCSQAQEMKDSTQIDRAKKLQEIITEFQRVKNQMSALMAE